MPQPNLNRERFILATVLSTAVMAVNAAFCVDPETAEKESINADSEYLDKLAGLVAAHTSRMAVEDTIAVLENVLRRRQPSLRDLTQGGS
jgi:hypothetical protein